MPQQRSATARGLSPNTAAQNPRIYPSQVRVGEWPDRFGAASPVHFSCTQHGHLGQERAASGTLPVHPWYTVGTPLWLPFQRYAKSEYAGPRHWHSPTAGFHGSRKRIVRPLESRERPDFGILSVHPWYTLTVVTRLLRALVASCAPFLCAAPTPDARLTSQCRS